jgi:hypothetical protein
MPLNCSGSSQRLRTAKGVRLPETAWSFTTQPSDETATADQQARNATALDAAVRAIDTHYSYRDRVVTDWPALFAAARDHLLTAPDDRRFASRLAAALAPARDLHLWVDGPGGRRPSFRQPVARNVDPAALPRLVADFHQLNSAVWTGRFAGADPGGDIGYLALLTFAGEREAEVREGLDALDELRDCRALVLDLRMNGGGNELLARLYAAWFAEEPRVYARQVTRNADTGAWDVVGERRLGAANRPPRRYDGPVFALIGPGVMSSAEAFTLMLRQCHDVTLVGAPTLGSSGNPQPCPLQNGVALWLPSWRALDADGKPLEGRGVEPDVAVANSRESFRDGDPVLARALELARAR